MENDSLYWKRMSSMLEKLTGMSVWYDPLWEKNFYPLGYHENSDDSDESVDLDEYNPLDWENNQNITVFVTSLARAIQAGCAREVLELIGEVKDDLKRERAGFSAWKWEQAPGIREELLDPNSDLDYNPLDYNPCIRNEHSIYFGDLARTPEEYEQAALKLISNYWEPFCGKKDFFGLSKK